MSTFTPRSFRTSAPPDIERDASILAISCPEIKSDTGTIDDWIVSDFYAFKYLLGGLGNSQLWFTTAHPDDLIAKHGSYVHGNGEKKIVLSKDMLKGSENKLTPVCVVESPDIIERYLRQIKISSEAAAKDGKMLILMVFSFGLSESGFLLNSRDRTTVLSLERIKGMIANDCKTVLVSPNCISGGWDVTSLTSLSGLELTHINTAALTEPSNEILSHAAHMFGSVFAGSVTEALTSSSSALIDAPAETDGPQGAKCLQPKEPSEEQEETYTAFCASILKACRGDVWERQGLTFTAEDDHWNKSWKRSGLQLEKLEERWKTLETAPETHEANEVDQRDHHLSAMSALFRNTCPGDWNRGRTVWLASLLEAHADGLNLVKEAATHQKIDVLASIGFRLELARFADLVVELLDLPKPNNEVCLLWHRETWKRTRKFSVVEAVLFRVQSEMQATRAQTHSCTRFVAYIAAAIASAKVSDGEATAIADKLVDLIRQLKEFVLRCVLSSEQVIGKSQEWLRSISRGI